MQYKYYINKYYMYTNKYMKIINKIYLKYKRERGFLFHNYLCLFLMLLHEDPSF